MLVQVGSLRVVLVLIFAILRFSVFQLSCVRGDRLGNSPASHTAILETA